MTPVDELERLLRPAGGGIHTVSTGKAEQAALQRRIYGAADDAGVVAAWRAALAGVAQAEVAILAIPSDSGAGLMRGAAWGPSGLRPALLDLRPDFAAAASRARVIDVGDVRVIPHLLHDEMTSDAQLAASRRALYPGLSPADAANLPVSPLSIAERVCDLLLALNPRLRLLVLGGDHSVAWPVVAALARVQREPWAIVQPDAHTDLLPERLGVKYCFATWAYHANDLVGRGGRLVQVGIRASGKPREHWESTLGVRQFWAAEIAARGAAATLDDIVAHLHGVGVKRVYLSSDIDGTDAGEAPATGAPEPHGLASGFVNALIDRVGSEFPLIGADLCEVAPPVGDAEGSRRTCELGAQYLLRKLRAMAPAFAARVALLACALLAVSGLACHGGCEGDPAQAPPVAAEPLPPPIKSSLFKKKETATPTKLGQGAALVIRHITPYGAPVGGRVAIVRKDSGGRVELAADQNGRIEAALAPGLYLVGSPAADARDVETVDVIDRQGVLLIAGRITGTWPTPGPAAPAVPALEVTLGEPGGKPAAGAWAWLWVDPEKKTEFKDEARADANGVVRFPKLPPGKIFFGAEHPTDGVIDGQEIERAKDGPTTKAAFKLHSAGSIQGRIVDRKGAELADVPVSLSGALVVCPRGPLMEATRWQLTDADGNYRFHGLRRGRFRIEAGWRAALPDKRYSFPRRIHPPLEGLGTPPHPPSPKQFGADAYELNTMPGEHVGGMVFAEDVTAFISGRVEQADGKPAAGAIVTASFAPRTGGGSAPSAEPIGVAHVGAGGEFRLQGLLAGRSYRLRAEVAGRGAAAGASGEAAEVAPGATDARIVVK